MKPRPSQSPALTLLLFDSKGHSSRTETSYILTPLNPLLPTWRFWLQLTILLENRLSQPRATSSASCIPRSIRPCGMSREGGQPLPMLKNLTFCSLTVFGWLAAACVPSLLSTLNSARKESTQEMTVWCGLHWTIDMGHTQAELSLHLDSLRPVSQRAQPASAQVCLIRRVVCEFKNNDISQSPSRDSSHPWMMEGRQTSFSFAWFLKLPAWDLNVVAAMQSSQPIRSP